MEWHHTAFTLRPSFTSSCSQQKSVSNQSRVRLKLRTHQPRQLAFKRPFSIESRYKRTQTSIRAFAFKTLETIHPFITMQFLNSILGLYIKTGHWLNWVEPSAVWTNQGVRLVSDLAASFSEHGSDNRLKSNYENENNNCSPARLESYDSNPGASLARFTPLRHFAPSLSQL